MRGNGDPDAGDPTLAGLGRERTRCDVRFNAPLADARAARLVERVLEVEPDVVVDFGCGRGALLLTVVAADARVRGVGIDIDESALDDARETARTQGLAERVTFVAAEARAYDGDADVAIDIGASHAFGGLAPMLERLPGQRAIVGDGYWAAAPDTWCVGTFGELPADLDEVRNVAAATGWRVTDLDVSTLDEWDTFESAWRAGVTPEVAARRKAEYDQRYRGVLGFAWLVLDRVSPRPAIAADNASAATINDVSNWS